MKNKLQFFIVLVFGFIATSLNAQEMSPEMEAFIARMDGANLEELEKELDEGIEGLKAFAGFFEGPGSEDLKDYTKEEEAFEESFKIDTASVAKAIGQFDKIGFQQIFRDDKSFVKFQKIGNDYWNTMWMEEGMEEQFIPKTIFYKDGTNTSTDISDNELSFFFEKPWGDVTVIDSIKVDYNIRYTAAYDSLVLAKSTKKVKYKDGFIKVEKLEKNHLYLTVSDEYADGLYLRALNSDGKTLNQNSSSFSPMPNGKSKDGFGEILKLLEEVQTKLKAKKFEDTESLKKYLLKKVGKIESVKDKDGVYHKKYYFEGNIESIQLYIETEQKSKTISFTATNQSGFGDIILMQSQTENIFLDANAKELFRTPIEPIQSLGSRYFRNDSLFYHLDLKNQKLNLFKAVHAGEAPNGLAFIKVDEESKYRVYDAEYEPVSEMEFENLYVNDDTYVQGISNNENYILDGKGTIKKLEGISNIQDPFDGRLAAKSNDKYGFIDASGEVVIPFEYIEIENFKDGHAVVAKEDYKYGLIDINGKTVLPLIYNNILSFKSGFAWVSTDDAFQLIDKDGKVLITEQGGSYSMSRSGSEITLQFGGKKYDGYGNLISDDAK